MAAACLMTLGQQHWSRLQIACKCTNLHILFPSGIDSAHLPPLPPDLVLQIPSLRLQLGHFGSLALDLRAAQSLHSWNGMEWRARLSLGKIPQRMAHKGVIALDSRHSAALAGIHFMRHCNIILPGKVRPYRLT